MKINITNSNNIKMEENETIAHQTKILEAMSKVRENLIKYKKKINGTLVVYKNGKIMHIKP